MDVVQIVFSIVIFEMDMDLVDTMDLVDIVDLLRLAKAAI